MAGNKRGNADRSLPKPAPRQQNDGFSLSQLQETRPTVGRSTDKGGPDEKEGLSGMMKELLDNEDQLSKLLLHGNIDCKSLAKVLPVTTQDLIDGKTTADDVMSTLQYRYIELVLRDRMVCQLSKRTIPENWCRNDKQRHWWAKAQIEFQGDLLKRRNVLPLCLEFGDALELFTLNVQWKCVLPFKKRARIGSNGSIRHSSTAKPVQPFYFSVLPTNCRQVILCN